MACVKVCFLIFVFWTYSVLNGQTLTYEKQLYKDLFDNHTKEILPRESINKPLEVGVTFYYVSLNHFNEFEETLSILGVFSLNWTDPSLQWDGTKYGHIYSTVVDPKDMWTPSLFLINRVNKLQPIGHDITFPTTLLYSGEVYFAPGDVLEAKCSPDISRFPFDTQKCEVEILPWGIVEDILVLKSIHRNALLDWYTSNSDWSLLEYSTEVRRKSGYSLFYFNLKIKRQPLYHATIIILPTILFALLNPLVFVLPVESGERVSLAMTILLSYAIFLTLVSASIPATSNPVCLLLVIMIVIICISGIITIGAILSAKYYYIENSKGIWSPLKRFVRWKLQRKNNNSIMSVDTDDKKQIVVNGKDISGILDCLFFYGSYIILLCTAVAYFVIVLS